MAPKKQKQKEAEKPEVSIDPNSSFTPESFERELKALAAKAKDETWTKTAREQAEAFLPALALISLAAAFANASQLAMSPVYGSIPAARYHDRLVMAACFTGWSTNLILGRFLPVKPIYLLPVLALYVPATQFLLFKLSGRLTAYWGPLATELLTLFPVVVGSVACSATYLERAEFSWLPRWLGDAAPGIGSWGVYRLAERLSQNAIQSYIGKSILVTRVALQFVLGLLYAAFAPSKLLLYAIPGLLHTALLNPHVATPHALQLLNSALQAQHGWTVLDQRESLTGYVSVIENDDMGLRVMRCDHSLLGGEWIKYRRSISEPIYGIFAMLEAVRLVGAKQQVPDKDAKALVIGMGVGTTPSALVSHGIDTTIVEIDQAVYDFAIKYFNVPTRHTPVIQDAVAYARKLANASSEQFNYIVNDVFTGGAEPIELFTLEFLQDLHTLLTPQGVIAINYAGDSSLPPPKIVLNTIKNVFPSCRIYREHPRNDTEVVQTGVDFANMVFFCQKSEGRITFRNPTQQDTLGSIARDSYLLPKHEVLESDFLASEESILARNSTDQLVKWHEKSALGHWEIMRTVIPGPVWEAW
ncbi:hypothetical protein RB594_002161 [Gaeumannomyces avenae]